jgi:thioredoxin 1
VLDSPEPVRSGSRARCGPCRRLDRIVGRLAEDGYRVCTVDVREREDLATRYRVNAVPTVLIIKGGEEVARFVGIRPGRAIREALERARDTTAT